MSAHKWWQLLRVGRSAGRGARQRGLRFASLMLATLALGITATTVLAGFAVQDGRQIRGSERSPQYIYPAEGPELSVRVREFGDTVDGFARQLVYVEPVREDASPPPGLEEWPKPGQAVLSPALRADLAAEDSLGRYGKVVGTIAPQGLEVPEERLAYVRPSPGVMKPDYWLGASGFGDTERAGFGDAAYVRPDSWVIMTAAGLLGLPSLALTVLAARSGAAERDRRLGLLDALGAGRRARAALCLGEALPPVALGTALACVPTLVAMSGDVRLPVVDFVLPAVDIQRWAVPILGGVVAASLAVLLTVLLLHRTDNGRSTSTRPRSGRRFASRRVAWCFPLFLLLAVHGSDFAASNGGDWLPVYLLGVVGVLATAPAVVAVLLHHFGGGLLWLYRRGGYASALVAGRWIRAHPGVLTRLVASLVIAIGLVTQMQLHASRLNDSILEAQAVQERVGDRVVTLGIPDGRPDVVRQVIDQLPAGVHSLAVVPARGGGAELRGTCPAIVTLGVPCPSKGEGTVSGEDVRLREIAAYYAEGGPVVARVGKPENAAAAEELVLVAEDGRNVPVLAVKRLAFAHFPYDNPGPIGGGWLSGSAWDTSSAAWIRALGGLGLGLLAFASLVTALGHFLRVGQRLAPLSVLTSSRRVFSATAGWAVFVPVVAAGVFGSLASLWLGGPLVAKAGATLPSSLVWVLLAGSLVAGAAVWLWATRAATALADNWRPTQE